MNGRGLLFISSANVAMLLLCNSLPEGTTIYLVLKEGIMGINATEYFSTVFVHNVVKYNVTFTLS